MKRKTASKNKLAFQRPEEVSRPLKHRKKEEKKKSNHFKPWQIDLAEEE